MARATIPMHGKVVLITGGYTALGRALAGGFAKAGADLGLIARTPEKLEEAARDLRALGVRAIPLVADITDEAQVVAAFAKAKRELGRIDVLVNNTGLPGAIMPVEEMDLREWNSIIATNLTGAMLCCREAVRQMRTQGGGAIVNIGSTAGKRGVPFSSAYSASKAGLIALTQALAQEVGKKGIRANCIMPGRFVTLADPSRHPTPSGRYNKLSQEQWSAREKLNLLGATINAWDMANAAVFLASDESRYITAVGLPVDAGLHANVPDLQSLRALG